MPGSSRTIPRRMCSGSMAFPPSWLASYLAKKITLRAFSVYFSNIVPPNLARLRYNLIRQSKVKDAGEEFWKCIGDNRGCSRSPGPSRSTGQNLTERVLDSLQGELDTAL